jgi:hypothetical protein
MNWICKRKELNLYRCMANCLMDTLNSSYNRLKNMYRMQRANIGNDNWVNSFYDKRVLDFLIQTNFISNQFKFRLSPYKFYSVHLLLWWFIQRLYLPVKNAIGDFISRVYFIGKLKSSRCVISNAWYRLKIVPNLISILPDSIFAI